MAPSSRAKLLLLLIVHFFSNAVLANNDDVKSKLDALVQSLDRLSTVIDTKFSGTLEARLNAIERDIQTSERNRLSLIKQKKDEEVFFSVSTSKRVECYSCVVNFDTVHTMSHVNLIEQKSTFEAPSRGIFLFQFHALAEAGSPVKV